LQRGFEDKYQASSRVFSQKAEKPTAVWAPILLERFRAG
jgi:hypothetical protein